jgi:hypothetical protein
MTRNLLGALVAVLVLAPPASSTLAADPAPPAARHFDPATVTTVSGEVTAIHEMDGRQNEGLHVDLKTADGVLDVHLGPSAYLAKQHLAIATGDALEVTGSKVEFGGKAALIAQSVRKGDTTVTLRDAQGTPAWAGRGRR